MLNDVRSMPTQSAQLWLTKEIVGGVKWEEGRAMAAFAPPLSSCTDMNQVLPHEAWNQRKAPKTLAYLCGAFPDAPAKKSEATKQAREMSLRFMNANDG